MNTPASAQQPSAQASCATVTFKLTESQAAQCGLAERFRAALKQREARAQKIAAAQAALDAAVATLLEHAANEQWSGRKLAAKCGIPESTLRWIRANPFKSLHWLPRIEKSAQRVLQES